MVNDNQDMFSMLIISGSSHMELAQNIAKNLFLDLVPCELGLFSNGETRVKINKTIRGNDVVIVQTGYSKDISVNDIVIETALLIDACNRSSAKSVTLIMPCYPYARQDRKDSSRVPISAKVIANLLGNSGTTRIVCMDLHASQIQGFTDCPTDNLYSVKLVHNKLHELYGIRNESERGKYMLISPDAGAAKRTEKFSDVMKLEMCLMHKQRDYSKPGTVKKNILVCEKDTDFSGKTAIITDDMIDSGGTFIKACETLIERGFSKVIGVITHGYFTGSAIEKINASDAIEKIIVTNSICQTTNIQNCPKLEQIDVSTQLAEAIKIIHEGGSMADLF
jgi:ribose-phosphate pyrophosphokinase